MPMIIDLTPEEAARWLDAAPQAVQDAVTGAETAQAVDAIGKEHGLRIDQIGFLLRLTTYLLVGYSTPQQAQDELIASGFDAAQSRQLLTEVNRRIFAPLEEKMRAAAKPPRAPAPRYQPQPASSPESPLAQAIHSAQHPPQSASNPAPRPPLPITDPERELPLGEPPAPTAPAPSAFSAPVFHQPQTTNRQPPPPVRMPAPAAMHAAPPRTSNLEPRTFPTAPLPPRSVLPSSAFPAHDARPSRPDAAFPPAPRTSNLEPRTASPSPRTPVAPPQNLPGAAPIAPPAPAQPSSDPYREPIE